MSSEKTPNLQLHKWQASDYVLRTEFNDNFAKIDDHAKQVTEQLVDVDRKAPTVLVSGFTSADVQTALNTAQNGSSIIFPEGRYSVSEQMTCSSKEIHIVTHGKVVFVESAPLNVPLFLFDNISNSTIKGLFCEGAETYETFTGASGLENAFIKVSNSRKVKINDVDVESKSYNIILENCNRCNVDGVNLDGVLTVYKEGANYSSVVYVKGGSANMISKVTGENIGSGVLIGGVSSFNHVKTVNVNNCQDNGVYVSSGIDNTIDDVKVDGSNSSGVKVRGSGNHVKNCNVKNVAVGYTLTGNGTVLDVYGANGYGNVLESCKVENATLDGISLGAQDGYYGRDFKILNNTLVNVATSGGTYAGVRGGGNRHQVKGNTFITFGGDYAIVFAGTSADKLYGLDISDNKVMGGKEGIRIHYIIKSKINKNEFKDITGDGVHCRYVEDSDIKDNDGLDNVNRVVICHSTYSNLRNKIEGNKGTNISIDLQNNYVKDNLPVAANYTANITSIPFYIGQRALKDGIFYEAVGITSSADWKQVTN